MALVASLCFASGNLIEKWAVDRMPPFSLGGMGQAVRALLRSRWWLVGAAVSVIGLPIQMIAYSRLAISIVQSISVAGIVVLVGVASLLYGERFGRRELTGLALAVGSLVLVSLSLTNGADSSGRHDSGGAVLVSTVCALVVVGAALLTPARKDRSGFVFGVLAGLLYRIEWPRRQGPLQSRLAIRVGGFGSACDRLALLVPLLRVLGTRPRGVPGRHSAQPGRRGGIALHRRGFQRVRGGDRHGGVQGAPAQRWSRSGSCVS